MSAIETQKKRKLIAPTTSEDRCISAVEKAAIDELLNRVHDAWTQGDGKAYAACFTEDSDYVTFNGMHLHGRSENERLHSALFRNVLKGSRIDAHITGIDLLSETVALVHTTNDRKNSLQSIVLVKTEGGWLIRSFQNTKTRPLSIRLTRWLQGRVSH